MKNKRIYSFLILFAVCIVTAFSFLKGSAVSSQKNEIKTNPDTEYQITYELNGGRFEGEYPKTFKISQETSIPNPIKDGSEFLGWTINDKTDVLPIKNYKIPSMTQGDIKLTANWQLQGNILVNGQTFKSTVESMSNFNNVTEIQFIKDTPNPNGINLAQNGSIKANIDANILTIACEDEIIANTDCDQMFWGFNKIKTIKFDNFNTSQVRFMNGMFRSCESLTTLDLSSFDTSKVTDTVWMFFNCTKLNANITIMNPDVTYYNNTFQGCSTDPSARFIVKYISPKTKEIARQIVSTKSDNSNVFLYEEPSTLLDGQTFNNKIKSLSSFTNVYKVIFDYGIPSNISSYPNVDVSGNGSIIAYVDGDTLYVVSNGDIIANPTSSHLFRYCYNLVSIDFTNNFKTDDVTQINSMFESSNRLTEIKGLEKFNTNNVKDMSAMFFGCSSLKTANTTNFNTSQVTNMSYMFKDCNNLSGEITISNLNTNYYREMFTSCSTDPSAKFIVKYTTSETKEVARKMVETKSEKSNVYLDGEQPNIIASGEIFNQKLSAMPNFDKVTEIQFVKGKPNPNGTDVSEAGDGSIKAYIEGNVLTIASEGSIYANPDCSKMFYKFGYTSYGNSSVNKVLNKIIFKNFNTSKTINMSRMFESCEELQTLDLSNFNTSNVTDMSYMFTDIYTYDRHLNLSMLDVSNVKNMNYMFSEASLTTINFENWNTQNVQSMSYMFSSSPIHELSINHFNTQNVKSIDRIFYNCYNLEYLDLNNWNTSNMVDINRAFLQCKKLKTLKIDKWDTSKVTNVLLLFAWCENLEYLDLSNWNTTKLDKLDEMFEKCYKLSGSITIMNPYPTMYNYMFDGCSTTSGRFVVNYKSGCRNIAQNMVNTKASNSNVVLGTQKSLLNEDIPNKEEPSVPDTVVLTIKDGNKTTIKEILAGEIGSLNTPSKEGMVFSGYFYDAEFTNPVSERDIISEDTTIYIKWEEVPQKETPQEEEIPQEENKDESL